MDPSRKQAARIGFLLLAGAAFALGGPAPAPVLAAPDKQIRVSTVAQLMAVIERAIPGQTLMLEDGIYDVSRVEPLIFRAANVTLYGASRDPSKVILKGQGFASANTEEEMIKVESTGFTLAYLTLKEVRGNALKLQSGGNHGMLAHNVHFIDICERAIKGPDVAPSRNGIVRHCLFEQKTPITAAIPNLKFDGDYIAGMDMMKIEDWKIQDNTFRNIRGMNGGGRAAVFLWNGCKRVTVERNAFTGCDRAIAFGNPAGQKDMLGGIARNNFITAGADISIEVCNSESTRVYQNTVYSGNPAFHRTFSYINCGAGNVLMNNLVMGNLAVLSGAAPRNAANLFLAGKGSAAGWFRNPEAGDLRLTPKATPALGKGVLTEASPEANATEGRAVPHPSVLAGAGGAGQPNIGADQGDAAAMPRAEPDPK